MSQPPEKFRQYLRLSSVGIEMGLSVGVGFLIGYLLDGYFDTKPILLLVFSFLGMADAFRSLYRLVVKLKKDFEEKENQSS